MKARFLASLFFLVLVSCQTQKLTKEHELIPEQLRTPSSDEETSIDASLGEKRFANEENTFQDIVRVISNFSSRRFSEGRTPALRDAHAKSHGCVRANFHVENNLTQDLARGVFVPGKDYKALIRYSNGGPEPLPDSKGDARGMAIKLLGVKGPKILSEERNAETQDFVMINHPAFFVNDPTTYLKFITAFHRPGFLESKTAAVHLGIHKAWLALKISSSKIEHPLQAQYWSMTPYQLGAGSGKKAIKFTAKPCSISGPQLPDKKDPDFLQHAMVDTLSTGSACFNFYVQIYKNPDDTPIEDSTVVWKEEVSPLQKVATITIPRQNFNSPSQMTDCENLSFTPWHALHDHKPLGAINRTRRVVYSAISKLRHQLNRVPRQEPTGLESF